MKLQPHHYILAGLGVAVIMLGFGIVIGRSSKQCPVYVNSEATADSIRLEYEKSLEAKWAAERDLWQHRIDSAVIAAQRPIKRQVSDAARTLSGLPNDSIADGLLADPE